MSDSISTWEYGGLPHWKMPFLGRVYRGFQHRIERRFGLLDQEIRARYLMQSAAPALNIGCGNHPLPGWLNTDFIPTSQNIMYMGATRPFPFDDEVFEFVYSEHMIEHIPYLDGLKMLTECYRVLKPGGRIRIATPNFTFLLRLCRPKKTALENAYVKWSNQKFNKHAPEDNETFVINNFVRDWGHCFIYDEATLRGALNFVGFTDIALCKLNESKSHVTRDLENESRMPPGFLRLETLILEASKAYEAGVNSTDVA